MSVAAFQAPRRRAVVYEAYDAPFPVPCDDAHAEAAGRGESVYRAHLVNEQVLVRDPAHIQQLYGQGYFGKGILSRARPNFSISDQWQEFRGRQIPVISQARYEQLLSWRQTYLRTQGLDEDDVNQTLARLSEPIKRATECEGADPAQAGNSLHQKRKRKRSSSTDEHPHVGDPASMSDSSHLSDSSCNEDSETDSAPQYVLVVKDGDEEEGVTVGSEVSSNPNSRLHGEVRLLPFNSTEVLQLTLEEGFFLVYALGCLSIHHNQTPLSISELWRRFRRVQPGFESSYAAYHHYRSRGWVPKTGAKYGAHFMLYRKGPPFYHASYSVVVERVSPAGEALHPFTWRSLAALNRITANVSKELMMCYVIYPADLSGEELNSPLSLLRLTVQEVVIKRWISSRERAELDDI